MTLVFSFIRKKLQLKW